MTLPKSQTFNAWFQNLSLMVIIGLLSAIYSQMNNRMDKQDARIGIISDKVERHGNRINLLAQHDGIFFQPE